MTITSHHVRFEVVGFAAVWIVRVDLTGYFELEMVANGTF